MPRISSVLSCTKLACCLAGDQHHIPSDIGQRSHGKGSWFSQFQLTTNLAEFKGLRNRSHRPLTPYQSLFFCAFQRSIFRNIFACVFFNSLPLVGKLYTRRWHGAAVDTMQDENPLDRHRTGNCSRGFCTFWTKDGLQIHDECRFCSGCIYNHLLPPVLYWFSFFFLYPHSHFFNLLSIPPLRYHGRVNYRRWLTFSTYKFSLLSSERPWKLLWLSLCFWLSWSKALVAPLTTLPSTRSLSDKSG